MVNAIIPAGYTQILSFSQVNISQSQSGPSSPSEQKTATDRVNISDEAKLSLISSLFPSSNGNSISIKNIEEALTNATASVEKRLQLLYRRIGISSGSQMKISVARDGSIMVNGKSPESDALSEAINTDDELANTIRGMSANASLLKAFEKYREFAEAYDKDPVVAVKTYGYLFEDEHKYNVSFSVQNGHIDTEVEYV